MAQNETLPSGRGYKKEAVDEYIEKLDKEAGRLKQENSEQLEKIKKYETAIKTLADRLKEVEKPFSSLQAENQRLKADLQQTKADLQQTKSELQQSSKNSLTLEDTNAIAGAIVEAQKTAKQVVFQAKKEAMDIKQNALGQMVQMESTAQHMQRLSAASRQQIIGLFDQMDKQLAALSGQSGLGGK